MLHFIDEPKALFAKLNRTFYRRESYGDHQVDWVFDFCITAWHLVDWVARERNPNVKGSVRCLQEDVKLRCPELFVCEQVCNGAKHLVLDNAASKTFDITTQVAPTGRLAGFGYAVATEGPSSPVEMEQLLSSSIICLPEIEIIDVHGKKWSSIALFLLIMEFWRDELGIP